MNESLLPSGKEILKRVKAAGKKLPEDQERDVLAIGDDEAMSAFLAANLGDTMNPDEMTANSVFSGWLCNKLNVPPMLLTIQLDNIMKADKAIESCNKALEDDKLTPEQRTMNLRSLIEAIRLKGVMVKNASALALLAKPPAEKAAPRNAPPDTLSKAPNVVVQINNRVQGEGNEAKPEPKTITEIR